MLHGAANPEGAQALIDYMLGEALQADMPLNMFVYPVVPEIELPDVFVQYAPMAHEPAEMTPEAIGPLRDDLIEQWVEVVLR